jgi:putative membrane protein
MRTRSERGLVCLFGAALCLATPGLAQPPRVDQGAQKMLASADSAFAMKAAQGGLAEVQMGKLAAEKGASADVKAFGQQMVDDHTKANDQLMSIAQKQNMTLPTTLDAKDQTEYDKLSGLSGAEFDKEYIKCMVKDHNMDVKDFQKEANSGKNAEIKNFASQTLPVLQGHLEKIKAIQAKGPGAQSTM